MKLSRLYSSHDDYVTKMQTATDRTVAAGFLLPPDADKLMTLVRASSVGTPPQRRRPDCSLIQGLRGGEELTEAGDTCPTT